MKIWFKDMSIDEFAKRGAGCMVDHVGIVCTEVGDDYLKATMPVDHRTKQPIGLLHGGASVVLAETLMSMGANFVVDQSKNYCVGLEINANHIRSARDGVVTGTARPFHIGKSTQVWETKIEQDGKLICVSRMTLSVLSR